MIALVEIVCWFRDRRGRLDNREAVRALVLLMPLWIVIRIYRLAILPDRRPLEASREVSV